MDIRRWFGPMLAAVALAFAAIAFFARRPGRFEPSVGPLIAVEIRQVAVGGSPPTGVVLLGAKDRGVLVPLFISASDAQQLEERRAGKAGRGLAALALEALGAKLSRVVLDSPRDGGSAGSAELLQRGERRLVRGSTGDLLDWAVGSGAPIWVTSSVLAKRGLTERQLREIAPGLAPATQPAAPPEAGPPSF
ncbi:MAG: hypothetical protein ACYCWW_01865 [Deltaproteobacteria bacterium]